MCSEPPWALCWSVLSLPRRGRSSVGKEGGGRRRREEEEGGGRRMEWGTRWLVTSLGHLAGRTLAPPPPPPPSPTLPFRPNWHSSPVRREPPPSAQFRLQASVINGINATAHGSVGALPLVRHQAYAREYRHSHARPRRVLRAPAGVAPPDVAQCASLVLGLFRAALSWKPSRS